VEKSVRVTNSDYVRVAVVIQHAMRMLRVALSSVAGLPLPCFSHII